VTPSTHWVGSANDAGDDEIVELSAEHEFTVSGREREFFVRRPQRHGLGTNPGI
jgi:hypothetical protein